MWKTLLALLPTFAIVILVTRVFAASHEIPNPIATSDFKGLAVTVIKELTQLALVVAVVAIVIVGFQLVVAGASGKADEAAKLKTTLLWVLIGTAIIAGAGLLAETVITTIQGL